MITKKTIKKIAKEIQKNNSDFEKMSDAEKRVRIAKDVIAGLKAEKLIPIKGSYIGQNVLDRILSSETEPNNELRDLLKDIPTCKVCARGAISVCAVKRFNNFNCGKAKQAISRRSAYTKDYRLTSSIEKEYFEKEQVDLIERTFEGPKALLSRSFERFTVYEREAMINFREKHNLDAGSLMAAIMANIIKNDGEFKP